MKFSKVYISSAISHLDEQLDFGRYLTAGERRRMSLYMRKAIYTAREALESSGVELPMGIIVGTGTGSLRHTLDFLKDMGEYGETALKPGLFMQSTHNTFATTLAIHLGCHGFNSTHSHCATSLEAALLEAAMKIQQGNLSNVLVEACDEMTSEMEGTFIFDNFRSATAHLYPESSVPALRLTDTAFATLLTSEPSDVQLLEIKIGNKNNFHLLDSLITESNADTVLSLGDLPRIIANKTISEYVESKESFIPVSYTSSAYLIEEACRLIRAGKSKRAAVACKLADSFSFMLLCCGS